MLTVGFAGVGRMGFAMARNLLAAGFPLVVWNRTAERCAPLVDAGIPAAASAAVLLEEALSNGLADADIASVIGLLTNQLATEEP